MKKRLFSILLALCMVFCLVPVTVQAEGETGVAINGTNFPDANFSKFVAEQFDKDGDGYLSDAEIAAVTLIDANMQGFSDLTGIEYFTALEELRCYRNQLTSLDVSQNIALDSLYCDNNQLTSLDVSSNTALKYLHFSDNQLTSVDLSKNTALKQLGCENNSLTSLDLGKNTQLTSLWCSNNPLISLDLSSNTELTILWCNNNQLTSLDLSRNIMLDSLYCSNNQLTSLDFSQISGPRNFECFENTYQIALDENRNFDLATLPVGFDVSKASGWSGGSVSGTTLTVPKDSDTVTYTYDCGKGKKADFTLKCSKASYTATFTKYDGSSTVQTVLHGEKAVKPDNPIKPGYVFEGWYEGTCLYDFDEPVTRNITLQDGWSFCDHSGSTAQPTCTGSAVCTLCSDTIAALGHDFSVREHDGDNHWMKCSRCDATDNKSEHTWNNGVVTARPTCTVQGEKTFTCTGCGATKAERIDANGHMWETVFQYDATHHWYGCRNCDAKDSYNQHTGGTATSEDKAVCEICGKSYGAVEPSNPEPSNPEPSNPEPSNPEPAKPTPSAPATPAPAVPAPVLKTTNVAGEQISGWDAITKAISTQTKEKQESVSGSNQDILHVDASSTDKIIPAAAVKEISSSALRGLHVFIGDSDAVTFLAKNDFSGYKETNFEHKDTITEHSRTIDFTYKQDLGATVVFHTNVPVSLGEVTIYKVDADNNKTLVGKVISNANGQVCFEITETATYVLEY